MTFNSPLNVVILAAGKGTRMYSDLPKVLHRLAGRPLLRHVLDTASGLNPAKTIVVYGYGGQAVPEAIGDTAIVWVEQSEQLGTGHAVQQALPALDAGGRTLILYGDVPLTRQETLAELLEVAADGMALLTMELPDATGYGRILRDHAGQVAGIVEHKDATGEQRAIREVNTGIMVVPNAHLLRWLPQLDKANSQGEYYLTDIVAMAVADGVRVNTAQPQHHWEVLGINSVAQLAHLERLYQHDYAAGLLNQGVRLMDPKRIDVRGRLSCGRNVTIDINCVFEGEVALADNVSIGAHCVLRDVKVGAGVQIAPFSLIEEAIVGADCKVGPYARIRPGTALEEKAHVGNFVEIKNSQVGQGSKINHLSYVGDSTVGRNVNIGAGTITCNYDGAYKHRTVIEDDAFIGSDTQLVAPVTVGKGATIGAGSTITKDTPPGELTLSRAKQVTISNWQRPKKSRP